MALIAAFPSLNKLGKDYRPAKEALSRFRFWHVESLLNQAADLLDRCLRDRGEYNGLRSQWELMRIVAEKENRDLKILNDRVDAGWLDQPRQLLETEIKTGEEIIAKAQEASDQCLGIPNWDNPGAMPAQDQKRIQKDQFHLTKLQYWWARDLYDTRRRWADEEKSFRLREMESRGLQQQSRLESMREPDGALNYESQARTIRERIERDLQDALDRIVVASHGLKLLYGYLEEPPLETLSSDLTRIDVAALWCRRAIKWLVAFGQLDQASTYVFSMKRILGQQWDTAIRDGGLSGEANFKFNTQADVFDSHRFVRLRGVCSYLIGGVEDVGPWTVDVSLPQSALSVQTINGSAGDKFVKIDQSLLPSCRLGRVETKGSFRPPEVAGAISLMNASPICFDPSDCWTVKLRSPTDGRALSKLKDCFIEINVVGRPKQ
jgi:hypothetical protein